MVEQTADRGDQPISDAKAPGWSLWVWWVVASLVGGVFGVNVGALVVFVGGLIAGASMDALAGLIAGASMGALVLQVGVGVGSGFMVGVLQWLVLRRQVAGVGWWVVASAAGWVVLMVMTWLGSVGARAIMVGAAGMIVGVGVLAGVVAGGAVGGFVVGVLQWLVLRRQVARASWWVVATVVGQVTMAVMAGVMRVFGSVGGVVGGVAGEAASLAMYGGITGIVLVQLLRQRAGEADETVAASA